MPEARNSCLCGYAKLLSQISPPRLAFLEVMKLLPTVLDEHPHKANTQPTHHDLSVVTLLLSSFPLLTWRGLFDSCCGVSDQKFSECIGRGLLRPELLGKSKGAGSFFFPRFFWGEVLREVSFWLTGGDEALVGTSCQTSVLFFLHFITDYTRSNIYAHINCS